MEANTDRRVRRTRNAINHAFMELLNEKEFEQITINDLSERANVNRGTFYLHYMDKYDLLDQYIEDHLSKMMNSCTVTTLEENMEEKDEAVRALQSLFVYIEENMTFFSIMLTRKKTSAFREQMLEVASTVIRKKIDGGGINQNMDKELMVQFMASAFVGIAEDWILNQMPHSPQYMAEQIWGLFERNQIRP